MKVLKLKVVDEKGMEIKQYCGNCGFWVKDSGPESSWRAEEEAEIGECRRYPPTVFSNAADCQWSSFPVTEANETCGEWAIGKTS